MRLNKAVNLIILLTVVAGYFAIIFYIYNFSQTRFFTVDEYQYGAATVMVSNGKLPYLDFFEHHTPLSYLFHSIFFLNTEGDFSDKALCLRKISFFYLFLSSFFLGGYFWLKTKKLLYTGLGAIVPLTIGFGLLSSIDYRADSFGAFFLLASLLINDINNRFSKKTWAILSGASLAIAFLMTQKYLYFGYLPFGLFFLHDVQSYLIDKSTKKSLIKHLKYWLAGNLGILVIFFTASIYLGFVDKMIELAFHGAISHEKVYSAVHFSSYLENYLQTTIFSTTLLLLLAAFYLLRTKHKYWSIVMFTTLISCFLIQAQYPYNFIFPCMVIGICAVAGLNLLIEQGVASNSYAGLFCLLVFILIIYDQISFTFNKTTNQHQLTLLDKLQRISTKDDHVIDNSGGYLFLNPASYYYMHGAGHRTIYKNIFNKQLINDYIKSEARFLIDDFRFPSYVKSYIAKNYIELDGSLRVYGQIIRPNKRHQVVSFKVIKSGLYYFFTESEKEKLNLNLEILHFKINGETPQSKSVQLDKGEYLISIPDIKENFYISSVPIESFKNEIGNKQHTMLFEY